MNRLVYLFELDSVRNSPAEIKAGQEALFEELVLNGNQVVLTFNQITDSAAFLSIIRHEEMFRQILELFRIKALQISPYGTKTASQYLQEALEKNLNKNAPGFIFSGVPIEKSDKELIEKLITILKNGDVAGMQRELDKAKETNAPEDEIERLKYLCKYVKLILTLSVEDLTGPVQEPRLGRDLKGIIGSVCRRYVKEPFRYIDNKKCGVEKFRKPAADYLQELLLKLTAPDSRTSWHDALESMRNKGNTDSIDLAKMMVSLCYNYSIEERIPGVSHHYIIDNKESFFQDFENRICRYWMSLQPVKPWEYEDPGADWSLAVRVLERCRKYESPEPEKKSSRDNAAAKLYEEDYEREAASWNKKISRSVRRYFLFLLGCILSFGAIAFCSDILDLIWENVTVVQEPALYVAKYVLKLLMLGVIGSALLMLFKIPDILDTVLNGIQCGRDKRRLKKIPRGRAYRNFDDRKEEATVEKQQKKRVL